MQTRRQRKESQGVHMMAQDATNQMYNQFGYEHADADKENQ